MLLNAAEKVFFSFFSFKAPEKFIINDNITQKEAQTN
jgi:hypothetical protein